MATKAMRHMKKLEKPRPLKQQLILDSSTTKTLLSVDEVIQELESLYININNCNFDKTTSMSITKVCNHLKLKGPEIETLYKEQLDRYFVMLRNASRDERVDMLCRMRLLEVIELRAMHWKINENLTNYYKQKLQELEIMYFPLSDQSPITTPVNNPLSVSYFPGQLTTIASQSNVSVTLGPGEVLRSSGKFAKPTKIPGKNYFKDEIVIRNSDSGKVMGIKGRRVHMIEELSDTIISFQRVSPGARDRLVQITGQSEDSISCSKLLIEDTIRRNASPVREKSHNVEDDCSGSSTSLNSNLSEDSVTTTSNNSNSKKTLMHSYSMSDANLGQYTFSVSVGQDTLKISGSKVDLVKTAKLVLEEYFAGQAELMERQNNQQMMAQTCLDINNSNNEITNLYSELANQVLKSAKSDSTPVVSSSSEEETFKAEGNPTEWTFVEGDKANRNKNLEVRSGDFTIQKASPLIEPKLIPLKNQSVTDLRAYLTGKKPNLSSGIKQSTSSESGGSLSPTSTVPKRVGFMYPMESRIVYSRDIILDYARSPFSQIPPNDIDNIGKLAPIVRNVSQKFDPDYYRANVALPMLNSRSRQGSIEKTEAEG